MNMCERKTKAFTNETWYTYKNNRLFYSISQEKADKMTIQSKCYYRYDRRGRLILIKEIMKDTKNEYEPSVFFRRYKYDSKNRLVSYDDGEVTRYKYRKNNIIQKELEIEKDTFEKISYQYKHGRVVLMKCSEGWVEKKRYQDNLIFSIRKNDKNEILFKEIRKLDNRGNVIKIKNTYRTFQYKYDNYNNIIYCKEFDNKFLYRETWNTYNKYKLIYTKEIEYINMPIGRA